VEQLTWQLRLAFFRDARDIARQEVQLDVARALELPVDALRERLEDGRALAALAEDYELASRQQVTGSPTYLLNEDRQRLYGNVGYRIIEANVLELLRDNSDRASWC
jgi:predicted DsbA family dithiol-disulfide isomerase